MSNMQQNANIAVITYLIEGTITTLEYKVNHFNSDANGNY